MNTTDIHKPEQQCQRTIRKRERYQELKDKEESDRKHYTEVGNLLDSLTRKMSPKKTRLQREKKRKALKGCIVINDLYRKRHERNLTVIQAAKNIGISHTSYFEIERGLCKPEMKTVDKIANYFDVDKKIVIEIYTKNTSIIKNKMAALPKKYLTTDRTVKKLKDIRIQFGYNIRDFAEKIGIDYLGYSRVESGLRTPCYSYAKKLSDLLDGKITPEEIIFGN